MSDDGRCLYCRADRPEDDLCLVGFGSNGGGDTITGWCSLECAARSIPGLVAPTTGGELLCDRCGRDYVVWFAPSDVWNVVMRDGDRGNPDLYGFCCPNCFTFLATVVHGIAASGWEVRPEVLLAAAVVSDGPGQ